MATKDSNQSNTLSTDGTQGDGHDMAGEEEILDWLPDTDVDDVAENYLKQDIPGPLEKGDTGYSSEEIDEDAPLQDWLTEI
jgi:hypothetical protein